MTHDTSRLEEIIKQLWQVFKLARDSFWRKHNKQFNSFELFCAKYNQLADKFKLLSKANKHLRRLYEDLRKDYTDLTVEGEQPDDGRIKQLSTGSGMYEQLSIDIEQSSVPT